MSSPKPSNKAKITEEQRRQCRPHGLVKETCGVRWYRLETFADVKVACNKFLRDRVERGLMKEWKYGPFGNQ